MNHKGRIILRCPACDGSRSSSFSAGLFRYDVCGSCESAWLSPAPDTVSLYGPEYFDGAGFDGYSDYAIDADIHRVNAVNRLKTVHDLPDRQHTLLDVGCAFGYGLDAARDAGWLVVGVELSEYARAMAQNSGHEVVSEISEIPATRTFDLVVFSQVLEHMPDPIAALQLAHERMAENGTILVETWDRDSRVARLMGGRWQQISPPSVLHLFTERGLYALLDRTGFGAVVVEPWSKRVSFATVLGIVRGKAPSFLGGPIGAMERSRVVGRRSFRYRLSDLVLAHGRRGAAHQ